MLHATEAKQVNEQAAVRYIRAHAHHLSEPALPAPLLERIGDARIVMLGEASHGTHEYYVWRSHITRQLIQEKGFNFIAVEGDWPDCYRLNRFIKHHPGSGKTAFDVLHDFNRWPTWMWANWEIVALTEWLREHNQSLPEDKKVGFYGLDVYSLWESLEAIMHYLRRVDPSALKKAEEAFRCFEPYRKEDGQSYARASQFVPDTCESEVAALLTDIRRKLPQYDSGRENVLNAEQNAVIAVNAEKYYRAMIQGGPHSWNLRDVHMADTLDRLLRFHGPRSKVVVWEHNTHIGDARATDMAAEGMTNIGELTRLQHHDKGVVLVGFGSYQGSVMAGAGWGAPMKRTDMPPARQGSWEHLLHQAGAGDKLLMMDDYLPAMFTDHYIDHRAIGVVYNPACEQFGNYVPSVLPLRYDAFIHIDRSNAVHPLHIRPNGRETPGTYPFGL